MRTRYYVDHQRGFVNEYLIMAADTHERAARIEAIATSPHHKVERITRKHAEQLYSLGPYWTAQGLGGRAGLAVPSCVDPEHDQYGFPRTAREQFALLPEWTEEYLLERA